ncbi:hypothetical protein MNKW57_15530 [Biformimicrobium ophioploci]|uniref:Uncharacterized protein n=2 Tax=Biformimicrobium ophioploci TaxID=3036711 RepID=A0ABQ6LYV9_9GAMM|nr:hypothetical protein MNKW57_15530 [Microbulbifer sp. NKW57]
MIVNFSAAGFVANQSPVARYVAPSFALGMIIAILAYLTVFYQALRNRNNVRLHAGYMLATPLILVESPFSRIIMAYLPFLIVTGSDYPQRIIDAIVVAMALSVVLALFLYFRFREYGMPFLVAAIFLFVEAIFMYSGTYAEWLHPLLESYAQVPAEVTLSIGFVLGALASYLGWKSTEKRALPNEAVVS